MNIQIANRLVALRKAHGLSQEALAEQLGISRQAVSKWERAEASPDTDNLLALCTLYGVSMDSILNPEKVRQEELRLAEETKKAADAKTQEKAQRQKAKQNRLHLPKTPLQKLGIRILKFPFPLFILALYFILGFTMHLWHPGWLLFLSLPFYYHLGGAFCVRRKKAMLLALPIPEVFLSIYLCFGFLCHIWSPSWIMLFGIPLYYWLVACFYHDEQSPKRR